MESTIHGIRDPSITARDAKASFMGSRQNKPKKKKQAKKNAAQKPNKQNSPRMGGQDPCTVAEEQRNMPHVEVALGSDDPQIPRPEEHKELRTTCKPDLIPRWKMWLDIAAVAVGGTVALIYLGQLLAMRQANDISRGALQSVQRAYIIFSGLQSAVNIRSADHKHVTQVSLEIQMQNTGTTPARTVQIMTTWASVATQLPYDFPFPYKYPPGTVPSTFVLGPKQTMATSTYIPIERFADLNTGKFLYLYGQAVYRDVFGNTPARLTEYCSEITRVETNGLPMDDPNAKFIFSGVQCPIHNCYDEDCPDYKKRISENE